MQILKTSLKIFTKYWHIGLEINEHHKREKQLHTQCV